VVAAETVHQRGDALGIAALMCGYHAGGSLGCFGQVGQMRFAGHGVSSPDVAVLAASKRLTASTQCAMYRLARADSARTLSASTPPETASRAGWPPDTWPAASALT